MAAEIVIECRDVCVSYGRQEVLRDVSLRVARGAFLPFVGPNGAGKTTLLRAVLGLLRPARGCIVTPFGGRPAGYVPQQKAIDPIYPVTLRRIVASGLYPQLGWWRRATPAQRGTVEAALGKLGLGDHADKTFAELSGGMKQKTLLARALVTGAEVFVLDEPTSELDEDSERQVLAHLARLAAEDGRTVLLAHHGLDLIAPHATEICFLDHGRARMEKPARDRKEAAR